MVLDLQSSLFVDLDFYRSSNADIANLNNPQLLQHLQTFGLDEGRAFSPMVDLEFYRLRNADLTTFTHRQLLEHLQTYGFSEERDFSPFIDLNVYRSNNADLANMNRDQLLGHLEAYGLAEGRSFSRLFDVNFYRAAYPDLTAAGLDNQQLYEHFLRNGVAEGRAASASFDVGYYLASNSDLIAAGFDRLGALRHFLLHGLAEGRPGHAIAAPPNPETGTAPPLDPGAIAPTPGADSNPVPPEPPTSANPSPPPIPENPAPPPPPVSGENPGSGSVGETPPEPSAPVTPPPPPPPPEEVAIANPIPTQAIAPLQTRITPDDLPAPFATPSASKGSQVVPVPENPVLNVPLGFSVNLFAEGFDLPRWLSVTPTGDVLLAETRQNQILLLRDTDGNGAADVTKVFAGPENGLSQPFGMAFGGGYFFVGNTGEVLRFPYTAGQEQLAGTGEIIAELPTGGHSTRTVVVSPDAQKLYVSIGSASNVEEEPLPRASVQVMNLDGSEQQTFASGLRNPVGLDFNPISGQLYTTVNERDGLGDDLVPDYLTGLSGGDFFGWPYAYMRPDLLDPRRTENGQSQRPDLAAATQTPDVLFQAHSAPLGLAFYDGQAFPQEYRNGAFVAFHGSWNRDEGTGYKLVFAPFDAAGNARGDYQDFLTGFLTDPAGPTTWGRPAGLAVQPDGSLLFTDDANGRIYRVQYSG